MRNEPAELPRIGAELAALRGIAVEDARRGDRPRNAARRPAARSARAAGAGAGIRAMRDRRQTGCASRSRRSRSRRRPLPAPRHALGPGGDADRRARRARARVRAADDGLDAVARQAALRRGARRPARPRRRRDHPLLPPAAADARRPRSSSTRPSSTPAGSGSACRPTIGAPRVSRWTPARSSPTPSTPAAPTCCAVDLYDHEAASPVLDSADFYADCRALLADGGVMTVNLFGRDARFGAASRASPPPSAPSRPHPGADARRQHGRRGDEACHVPERAVLARRAENIETRWQLPARKWLRMLRPAAADRRRPAAEPIPPA